MPTSAPGISERSRAAGFTLLELLLVLVIGSLTLGMVSLGMMPSSAHRLQTDAQRIVLLLQLTRDEAILRDRPIAFEADADGYRFLVREENGWQPLQDELLRARSFRIAPVTLDLAVAQSAPQPAELPLRIVFGREPVDHPFTLAIRAGSDEAVVSADGVGNFTLR